MYCVKVSCIFEIPRDFRVINDFYQLYLNLRCLMIVLKENVSIPNALFTWLILKSALLYKQFQGERVHSYHALDKAILQSALFYG